MPEPLIEICVEGVDGLVAAQEGGADRVELCASLVEGGITPSAGTVREAARRARVPFNVIIRPRGGDFLYSEAEFASMLDDVGAMRALGAAGVVIGCLTPDGEIDEARTRALVAAARPLGVTFHRAFDMTRDPAAALEALIRCGVDRVLTSGQRADAVDGIALLARLQQQAAGRIVIMACGALSPGTIGRVRRETGVTEMHFSAPVTTPSEMRFRNPALAMGGDDPDREYRHERTDSARVAATIAAARAA
jgi:copper homeostasis protein